MPLSPDELRRYARHLTLPEVGVAGQERLKAGSVLVVGTGGLGSPAALYLAAAGVGRIGLVDFDVVDVSNLQRQVLYTGADVGRPKAEAAAERLAALNPFVRYEAHVERVELANVERLVGGYDLVVDGTDNFPTRYLVHDACWFAGKPYVYGSIFRFEGQASLFARDRGPCYRCLFPEPPPPGLVPSCAEAGVLGVLPGLVGSIQAAEALKGLLGVGDGLAGRLLLVDALTLRFREVALARDPGCPLCGESPSQSGLVQYADVCLPEGETDDFEMAPEEAARRLAAGEPMLLLDVRREDELALAELAGSLWIPLHELGDRWRELPADRPILCVCHHGARSALATEWLRAQGLPGARNLAGGIDAWSRQVDSSVPRY